MDSWIGVCVALLILSGGIIARIKGDFFSRGMGIALFTNIFGLIALIFSTPSRARTYDDDDIHKWPPNAYLAVFVQMFLILILLLRYWFF
jgi:hypothetical protein